MFYDDIICSFTNSFYGSSSTNNEEYNTTKAIENLESIYVLGKLYQKPIDVKSVLDDISSRIWFTYRKGYSGIGGYGGLETDQGWGCMLRSGQMLLAECFLRIYLGRDFRWQPKIENEKYWEILSHFKDEKSAPYSIQQIATMGASSENISIGKWFGPNAIVQVLNKLSAFDDSNHLKFYICMDNSVFIDAIYESMKTCNKSFKCKKHSKKCEKNSEWDPLLLILPLRLGLNEFNEEYKESIKRCFELEQIIGMIGGKPNSAYYFYGYTDDSLLYLDPHDVQTYEQNLISEKNDESYHTKTFLKLKFANLDPSVALAFLCKSEQDFLYLVKSLKENVLKTTAPINSLFEIFDSKPCYNIEESDNEGSNKSEDEYVLL